MNQSIASHPSSIHPIVSHPSTSHPIQQMVARQKSGEAVGIFSVCSANVHVIKAAMGACLMAQTPLLIEATANQVNQEGGYTGMTPLDFMAYVKGLAKEVGYPTDKLILGGDHLGPLTWLDLEAPEAMEKAVTLVVSYVQAGFSKIHIDTSMALRGDALPLSTGLIANRAARLVQAAEAAIPCNGEKPVYVVGSEVPIPGGAKEDHAIDVTSVADFEGTVAAFRSSFEQMGLQDAWQRVVAVVVQPGVEFSVASVTPYQREAAKALCQALQGHPNLVFEGHSTDYQTPEHLKQMVEDGIAILKVGPGLTFAMREGIYALEAMERVMFEHQPHQQSWFSEVLENAMVSEPNNWEKHYTGAHSQQRMARRFSYADRSRYYMGNGQVKKSLEQLIANLRNQQMPEPLISQFASVQYRKIRSGQLAIDPEAILQDHIMETLQDYILAVEPKRMV